MCRTAVEGLKGRDIFLFLRHDFWLLTCMNIIKYACIRPTCILGRTYFVERSIHLIEEHWLLIITGVQASGVIIDRADDLRALAFYLVSLQQLSINCAIMTSLYLSPLHRPLWVVGRLGRKKNAESSPARFLFFGYPVGASAKRRVAIPRFNTVSFGKHSLMYMGPKVWSSVPRNVKEASIP